MLSNDFDSFILSDSFVKMIHGMFIYISKTKCKETDEETGYPKVNSERNINKKKMVGGGSKCVTIEMRPQPRI